MFTLFWTVLKNLSPDMASNTRIMKFMKIPYFASVFVFLTMTELSAQCNPAIYHDGYVGDTNINVYPLTATTIHQGSVPVYMNPSTITFQYNGFNGSVDVWVRKIDNSTSYSTYQSYIGLFTSASGTSTTNNLNVSNYPPGKYFIMGEFGAAGSVKRNRCHPYFIIARTLVNTTVLPECAKAGQTISVTWNGGSGDSNVNLVLRTLRNSSWYTPMNIAIPNTGSYNLVIPATGMNPGESYSLEINDGVQYVSANLPNGRSSFMVCKEKTVRGPVKQATLSMDNNIRTAIRTECACGSWISKKVSYGDVSKDIICDESLALGKNTNVNFNLQYQCSTTDCSPRYEAVITDPSGASSTSQIANNQTWNYLFSQTGNYSIMFRVYCNDAICPESCLYKITSK